MKVQTIQDRLIQCRSVWNNMICVIKSQWKSKQSKTDLFSAAAYETTWFVWLNHNESPNNPRQIYSVPQRMKQLTAVTNHNITTISQHHNTHLSQVTWFFCPILWARAWAWRSFCGFQSLSKIITVSAVARFTPSPPARVDNRKQKSYQLQLHITNSEEHGTTDTSQIKYIQHW